MTAGFDGQLRLWDVGAASALNAEIQAKGVIEPGLKEINDAKWHHFDEHLYASVHDGGVLGFWDSRAEKHMNYFVGHSGDAIALDFNHHNPYLVASGGTDMNLKVWDLRKPQTALMVLSTHTFPIQSLAFSPFYESVLASSGKDRRVAWWNLHDVLGDSQQMPVTSGWGGEGTPPGLIFLHAGHTAEVPDIAWNKNEPMVMASVGEDNQLEVFSWNSSKYSL